MGVKSGSMKPDPGTYVFILQSNSSETIKVGRWGKLVLRPGFYVYVGSAFGPGGVQARVSRHLRTDKRKHWHIDYLREYTTPLEVWVSYEAKHLEHEWAITFLNLTEMTPIQGFGCSDCRCFSHLFFKFELPNGYWLGKVGSIQVRTINIEKSLKKAE